MIVIAEDQGGGTTLRRIATAALGAGLAFSAVDACAQEAAITAEWKPAAANTTFIFANSSTGEDDAIKFLAIDGVSVKREINGTETEDIGFMIGLSKAENMAQSSRDKAAGLWPLKVGKSISFSHGGITTSGNSWSSSDDAEVAGIEQVTVPAGTFQTFIIKTSMANRPWFEGKWTCWYAPEIGYCAKTRWQRTGMAGPGQNVTRELKSVTKPE